MMDCSDCSQFDCPQRCISASGEGTHSNWMVISIACSVCFTARMPSHLRLVSKFCILDGAYGVMSEEDVFLGNDDSSDIPLLRSLSLLLASYLGPNCSQD